MSYKENVLLGYVDQPVPVADDCTYHINKIGGTPDWMNSETKVETVTCRVCSRECPLVLQIYCPLGQDSAHRTLYIFCCTNSLCWNKSDSWTVLRCQKGVNDNPESNEVKSSAKESWLMSEDNWDDADETVGTGSANTDTLCLATESLTLPQEPPPEDMSATSVIAMDDDSNDSSVMTPTPSQVIPEPLRVTFVGEFPWKVDVKKPLSPISRPRFCPFYVSVTEELDCELDSSEHITVLAQDYQLHDGNPFSKTRCSATSDRSGTESYEKSEVRHGDKHFYKFHKKLSRFPQQIVRYQWGGRPLLIRPLDKDPSPCQNCSSHRVFEFQLMPALVTALKLQDLTTKNNDPAVEFGTVLVFSCQASCWKEGDSAKLEDVVVQCDPDEELFNA